MYTLVLYLNNAPSLPIKDENLIYECVNVSRAFANLSLLAFLWFYNHYKPQLKSMKVKVGDMDATEQHFKDLQRMFS
jgi:hypothetical protein